MTNLKPKSYKLKATLGFTMLEILVGASIITASFIGVLTVFDRLTKTSRQMMELSQANFLMEEGLEIGRIFRDDDWTNLSDLTPDTDYFLTWTGSKWATSTTNALIDSKFDRRFKVAQVFRDVNDDIVPLSAGGGETLDPNTQLVTVSVAWAVSPIATTTKTISTYFTNLFN